MNKRTKRIFCMIIAAFMAVWMMIFSCFTVVADDTETPIVPFTGPVDISGLNLVLSGEIGLVYHFYVRTSYRNGYITLTCKDDTVKMNIADCAKDTEMRYVATYNLTAIMLSEQVVINVYDASGNLLATRSSSAEDYAKALLAGDKATEKEKNIAKTLINYGHYAQIACAEAGSWKIGKDYVETPAFNAPSVNSSVFDKYKIEWSSDKVDFGHLSMSLRLDYKTGIIVYIPTEQKPSVKVNGKTVEPVVSKRRANSYEIEIDGVNALNLENKITLTVNNVNVTFCVFSYCNLAVSSQISPNTVVAMRALYEFHKACVEYSKS